MADKPKIYVESCPIIDLAKKFAKVPMNEDRQKSCWFLDKLLEASRNGELEIVTSSLTVCECTHIEPGKPVPDQAVKEFFEQLLTSGHGGIVLVQPIMRIVLKSRQLRWSDGLSLGGMDSMHLATALESSCNELLTTDGKISKCSQVYSSKIKIISPKDTTLLPSKYNQTSLYEQHGTN